MKPSRAVLRALTIVETLAAVMLVGSGPEAVGADRFWNSGDGGSFGDPLNWDDGELDVPGANDAAIFDLAASYDVDLSTSATLDRFVIGSGVVSFRFLGVDAEVDTLNASTLTPGLAVGEVTGDRGQLRIVGGDGGAFYAVYADLGVAPGTVGTLILADPSAILEVEQELRIGNGGVGFLDLLGGASIGCSIGAVGRAAGAYGEAHASGAGTTLECSTRLSVGVAGLGILRIEDGAAVTSGSGIIAQVTGSSGEATVSGATWIIDGPLDVGLNGFGALRIEAGGVVESLGFGTIGTFADASDPQLTAHGDVIVDGAGSRWSMSGEPGQNDLYVGFAGTATLTSARGGRVAVDGDLIINEGGELGFVLDADSKGGALIDFAQRLRGNNDEPVARISFDDEYEADPGDRFTLLDGILGVDRVLVQIDGDAPSTLVQQSSGLLELFVLDPVCLVIADDCNGNGVDDGCDIDYGVAADCNGNGIPDSCDIADGRADDCNGNGVPDDCEIADGTAGDCNDNAVPDACEVRVAVDLETGVQSPVSTGNPIELELGAVPEQTADVLVAVSIVSDLDGSFEFLGFELNGLPVGTLFVDDGLDCPEEPQADTLVISSTLFNAAIGDATESVFTIRPNSLSTFDCKEMSWMEATLTYQVFGGPLDTNGNGIPDDCECIGDLDGSGDVGFTDLLQVLADWGPCSPGASCPSDLDNDDMVGFTDLLTVLARWGTCDV